MSNRNRPQRQAQSQAQQPQQKESKSDIRHITTKSGFQCDVPIERLDNWELMEALSDTSSTGTQKIKATITVAKCLLGEADKNRLIEHVRLEDGRVPYSKMDAEVGEILLSIGRESKNSPSSPA